MSVDWASVKASLQSTIAGVPTFSAYADALYTWPLGLMAGMNSETGVWVLTPQGSPSWVPFGEGGIGILKALKTARLHALELRLVAATLSKLPGVLNSGQSTGGGILNDLSSILTVQNALNGSNTTPTAAQQSQVKEDFANILAVTELLSFTLGGLSALATKAIDLVNDDASSFASGQPGSIDAAQDALTTNYNKETAWINEETDRKYLQPTLDYQKQDLVTCLDTLQSSINSALAAGSPLTLALSQLLTNFDTLREDYKSTFTQILAASNDEFGPALQAFNVQNATNFWQDTINYAAANIGS